MNRSLLTMVAFVCGLAALVSLLVFPIITSEHRSARAVNADAGLFMILFAFGAAMHMAAIFFKMTAKLGVSEGTAMLRSMILFKLVAMLGLALLIDGPSGASWGVGFWLAWIASIVGALSLFLAENPEVARKLAEAAAATKSSGSGGTPPASKG